MPIWVTSGAVAASGLAVGATAAGLPEPAIVGAIAIVLLVGAMIYRSALGLAIFAFAYPYNLTVHVGPLKWAMAAVLVGTLVLMWVIRQVLPNPPAREKTPLDWPVAAFAVATAVSLLSLVGPGSDPDEQMLGMIKAAGGFLLFLLTVYWLRDRRDLWLVVGAILATGLVEAAMTIIPVMMGVHPVSTTTRATGTTADGNLLAGFLVLVSPLVLAVGLQLSDGWRRLSIAGVATLVCGAALVATLSRSGWLGLATGVVMLAVLLPERRRQIAFLTGAVLLVLVIAGFAGPTADRLRTAEGDATTLAGRLPVWWATLQMFAQHPAFGVGVQNFGSSVRSYNPGLHINHAHNLFLNVAAERGVLGLLTFGALVVVLFRTLADVLKHTSVERERLLTAGLIASFVAFLVHSLFDVSYYDYRILLLFWLLVGVAACLPRLLIPKTTALRPGVVARRA